MNLQTMPLTQLRIHLKLGIRGEVAPDSTPERDCASGQKDAGTGATTGTNSKMQGLATDAIETGP